MDTINFQAPIEMYIVFERGLVTGTFTTLERAENLRAARAKHSPVIIRYAINTGEDAERITFVEKNLRREGEIIKEGKTTKEKCHMWVIVSQAGEAVPLREVIDILRASGPLGTRQ